MKKLFYAAILFATIFCSSCENSANVPSKTNRDNGKTAIQRTNGCVGNLTIVEIKGHEYIVIGPTSNQRIIHAEHCPCKNK